MPDSTPERIEKHVVIHAPVERVWSAISEPAELGAWFGIDLAGTPPLAPGLALAGRVLHEGFEHITWRATIVRVEPPRLLAWEWHPAGIDPNVDYSTEPPTVVTFTLEPVEEGTRLTVVESGFAGVPAARRSEAFRLNDQGWGEQMVRIARFAEEA